MKKFVLISLSLVLNCKLFSDDNIAEKLANENFRKRLEKHREENPSQPQKPVDLISAANEGQIESVKKFLTEEPDLNTKNIALIHATIKNQMDVVKLLLAAGADVNAKHTVSPNVVSPSENTMTALLYAAQNGNDTILQLLLEAGADVNAKTPVPIMAPNPTFGAMTALMIAARGNHVEIVKILLDAGSNPDYKDLSGRTAHDYAVGNPSPKPPFIRESLRPKPTTPDEIAREAAFEAKRAEIVLLLDAAKQRLQEEPKP